MMQQQLRKNADEELKALRHDYEQVKARIGDLDFVLHASLTERHLTCGNPNCRCHRVPEALHGPYCQMSWKEKGKTVSYFVSPEIVPLVQGWIENGRRLKAITDEMLAKSRKAAKRMKDLHATRRRYSATPGTAKSVPRKRN